MPSSRLTRLTDDLAPPPSSRWDQVGDRTKEVAAEFEDGIKDGGGGGGGSGGGGGGGGGASAEVPTTSPPDDSQRGAPPSSPPIGSIEVKYSLSSMITLWERSQSAISYTTSSTD